MIPFCGYNMGDYIQHWLDMGDNLGEHTPRIFYVNWFRKSEDGKWLWPGYGENSRVLKWMCERVEGVVGAQETPIGLLPLADDLDVQGLDITPEDISELLNVDAAAWETEIPDLANHLDNLGDRLPERIKKQLAELEKRLG